MRADGLKAYKVHPPGRSFEEDVAIHRAVRQAVGPDFTLMSDPVSPFNLEQAIRFGRELERLNYLWLEEPIFDEEFHSLQELTRQLEIPVVGLDLLVPAADQPDYVLIEANERVGLANHEPQPTAERFIDLLFPLSRVHP